METAARTASDAANTNLPFLITIILSMRIKLLLMSAAWYPLEIISAAPP
jgi:hypothetical protein